MTETKTCLDCNMSLSVEMFQRYWNNQRNTYYRQGVCRDCRSIRRKACRESGAARKRERMASDPAYKRRQLNASHKWRYGITLDEKEAMLAEQGGACALCGTTEVVGNGWAVDHDHACCPAVRACGKCIRGILCSRCNCGLGQFQDNPGKLQLAIAYLERTARP